MIQCTSLGLFIVAPFCVAQHTTRSTRPSASVSVATNSVSIPASGAHRREYLERAQGLNPTTIAQAYWD
jgi:hypothetical protein